MADKPEKYDGYSIASMILGIASIVFCFYFIIGLASGIVGLVFAIKQRKENPNKMATAGLITSIIGIVLAVLIGLFMLSFLSVFFGMAPMFANA